MTDPVPPIAFDSNGQPLTTVWGAFKATWRMGLAFLGVAAASSGWVFLTGARRQANDGWYGSGPDRLFIVVTVALIAVLIFVIYLVAVGSVVKLGGQAAAEADHGTRFTPF